MRCLLIFLLLGLPFCIFAQSQDSVKKGTLTGIVFDTEQEYAIQSATVLVYKKADSSLADFQLSNSVGEFNFQGLPVSDSLLLTITVTGYKTFSKLFVLDSLNRYGLDLKKVPLIRRDGMMEEVVVEAVVPIRMNGDTLEINPNAFKLDSNAVVEDMLRRVPGVTMWGDGTITVNGRKVDNVFVDGKPFFGSDYRIATQNLPKNAIDKIQVYQEQDYSKDEYTNTDADSTLTMDIKLKANKRKGYFGKGGVGVGTDDRYEADLALQLFNSRTRVGVVGALNNINKSANDIQAILQGSTFRTMNPSFRYVANFNGQGVNKVQSIGGNYRRSFGEITNDRRTENALSVDYMLRRNDNDIHSVTDDINTSSKNILKTHTDRVSENITLDNNLNVSYNKRNRQRDFSVSGGYTNSTSDGHSVTRTLKSDEDLPVSEGEQKSQSHSVNNAVNFSARLRNNDDDDRNLKGFNLNLSANYGNNDNERLSLSSLINEREPSKNQYFNRKYNTNAENVGGNLSFGYNALKRLLFGSNNLGGINIRFNNNLNISNRTSDNLVSDFDSIALKYVANDELTNNNKVFALTERPGIGLSKTFRRSLSNRYYKTLNVNANLNGQFMVHQNRSSFDYRNIDRNFQFFLPSLSLAYDYRKDRKYKYSFSLNYNTSAGIPSIDDLYPIIDAANLYSFNYGNPGLKSSYTHSLGVETSFNTEQFKGKKDLNMSLSGGYDNTMRAFADSIMYDSLNRRHVYPINVNNSLAYRLAYNINTSFRISEKYTLQLGYTTNFNIRKSPSYIDTIYSVSQSNTFNNTFNIGLTLGDYIALNGAQRISTNISKQSDKTLNSFKNHNYTTSTTITINYPKDFSLTNSVNYVKSTSSNNQTQGSEATLWNIYTTYRLTKTKQVELKFSAMDLLRQNKNITNSITDRGNGVSTTVTNGLQNFYMLTVSYFPRRFGGAAGRNRGGEMRGSRSGNGGGSDNRSRPPAGSRGGGNRRF
ncbi:MAG: TonB-dependent receptor [Niabella sp.]